MKQGVVACPVHGDNETTVKCPDCRPYVEQDYKHIKYVKGFDIYSKELFVQPIIMKRWIFNWKFPFIHRVFKKYTFKSLQKEINRMNDRRIVELLRNGFTK